MSQFKYKFGFLFFCLFFIQLGAVASQCPNVSGLAPDERGHWVSYSWHSFARAPSPLQFHLTFDHVTLVGARDTGFIHAHCVYDDSYENGLVMLAPNTTQANYTPLVPVNPAAWTFAASGQMATCSSSLPGNCAFR